MFPFRMFSVLLMAGASITSVHAAEVGVRTFGVAAPERGRDIEVTVWYPAADGGTPGLVGDNRIFKGEPATRDAAIATGRFPLVLLSHGSGARVETMGWLATKLAETGFVVVGPNHPGTTSGDSTPAATPLIWERTADLSAVIDRFSTDPTWSAAIDPARIGVVGFSLGGSTALEIAGARADLEAYARYCDSYDKWDCAWFAGGRGYVGEMPVDVEKVDLRKLDKARFEQSNQDLRIRAAVLVDPGLAQAYVDDSLKAIDIPLSFINLGGPGVIPEAVIADKLAALVPQASYAAVTEAVHFSFLPECKDGAGDFLKSVGEIDPICDETGSRSRADIHAELKRLIVDALQRSLKGSF
ncbi:alpha/beta hydrolase family protein [Shinella sp.]|uniref:alpha/beta hydrolase family protein n=1 Tax=Shinella sp. TaxID=1870904 RepID=UPI004035781B